MNYKLIRLLFITIHLSVKKNITVIIFLPNACYNQLLVINDSNFIQLILIHTFYTFLL